MTVCHLLICLCFRFSFIFPLSCIFESLLTTRYQINKSNMSLNDFDATKWGEKKLLHEHFHVKWKWNSGENVMWYGNIMLSDRVCGTIVKSYPIKWWCILAWFSKYLNRLRAYFQIGYSSHHTSFTIVGISTHIQLTWSKLMTLNGFF